MQTNLCLHGPLWPRRLPLGKLTCSGREFVRAWLLAFIFAFAPTPSAAAADETVRLHIVDRGIWQTRNKDVAVGIAPPDTRTMFPALTDPAARLLMQMPSDREMVTQTEAELANQIALALMRHIEGAGKRGVREFEITVIENIGPLGYFDAVLNGSPATWLGRFTLKARQVLARVAGFPMPHAPALEAMGNRQQLVRKFGRAYLMAIDRVMQGQAAAGRLPEVDFWVGSNGTFTLTEAHDVVRNFRDRISHVTLIDGRAFTGATARFIEALGEHGDRKVTITNTYGDMPGHPGDIALLSAAVGMQKRFEGLTVLLVEPLDAAKRQTARLGPEHGGVEFDAGVKPISSHVLWMLDPTGRFRVYDLRGGSRRILGDMTANDLRRGIATGDFSQPASRPGTETAERQREPTDRPPRLVRRQDEPQLQLAPPLKGPRREPPPGAVDDPGRHDGGTAGASQRDKGPGIGGVRLAIEQLRGDALPSIEALVYDEATERLTLVGGYTLTGPRIAEDDLAMALWLVFGPQAAEPQFSLDADEPRNPSGPWLKAVYSPADLRGQAFGEAMFIADFAMKKLALAARLSPSGGIEQGPPPVPGFKSLADFLLDPAAQAGSHRQWARFWLVVEEVVVRRAGTALYFERVKIGVRAMHQVPDASSPTGLRDVPTPADAPESLWAAQLTARFDEVAAAMPHEFGRLKEMAKAMALCKLVRQQGIKVDLTWATARLNARHGPATARVAALAMDWQRVQERPFDDGHRRGTVTTTHKLRLLGGADLTVHPRYVAADGHVADLLQSLRTAMAGQAATPVATLLVGGQRYYAKVLPITEAAPPAWRDSAGSGAGGGR